MTIQPITISTRFSTSLFSTIFAILCVATIGGFFFSRALVSIGSVALVALNLIQFGTANTFRYFWSNHFNKIALLLLVLSMISGFWSTDLGDWQKDTTTKLSLLILPLGFSALQVDKKTILKIVLYTINVMILITIINSMYIYIQNPDHAEDQYMLTTTYYGDHIRFSFLIALNILLNFYLYFEYHHHIKLREKAFLLVSIVVPFIYLHLLSARTGLMCAYSGLGLILFLKTWQYKKIAAIGVVLGILLLPVVAIQFSPRLKDKVQFMIYEATAVKNQDPSVQFNYTDNNRILSYKAAQAVIKDNFLIGVGSGDLRNSMKSKYKELYPSIPEEGQLEVPHMQFLSTAVAIGVPFSLLCIIGLIVSPLLQTYRSKLYLGIHATMIFLYFLVDAHLEIQFGLLLFLFYSQIWMLLEKVPKEATPQDLN